MASNNELTLTPSKGLKKGAAVRKRGKISSKKFLEVARKLFISEGYGAFSMRRIAKEANATLSNLQHYYKTKDDLFRAIMEHELTRYDRSFISTMNDQSLSPEDRVSLFVDFLLEDIRNPESAGFFFHLWSAATINDYAAKVMDEAYTHQCQNTCDVIEPLTPHISKRLREQRAALIVTMVDGLMLLLAPGKPKHARLLGIEQESRKIIMDLIRSPA